MVKIVFVTIENNPFNQKKQESFYGTKEAHESVTSAFKH